MVPASATQAVVAAETAAIAAWGARHGWSIVIADDCMHLDATTEHPVTHTTVVFHAEIDGYPAIPPAWTCRDAGGDVSAAVFPLAGQRPGVPGSIFHPNNVICAPWNRLAFGAHGGPHPDWTDLTEWKTLTGDMTRAHTIADMLQSLALHLSASPAMAA